jgi:predicted PurR-regulated permease PerM
VLNLASFTFSVLGAALNGLFILFLALYLTVDARRYREYPLVFLPHGRVPRVRGVLDGSGHHLGHWVLGQLVRCVVIGFGAWLGLGLIGVP